VCLYDYILFAWSYRFCLKHYNWLSFKNNSAFVILSSVKWLHLSFFLHYCNLNIFQLFYCILLIYFFLNDLDETRLTNRRTNECHQHSTPITTGNITLFTQNTHSSTSTLYITRRKPANTSNMTSYSALKRKTQRSDVSSNISRV
jgi:hypothetical protein